MDAIGIGAGGMMAAADRLSASAARTADGSGDLAAEAVEQTLSKVAFDASAAVVRTGEDMTKRLLDLKV